MKRKNRISLMMALLIVISTFATVPASITTAGTPPLVVTKQVKDGESWVNSIDAVVGDEVEFRITITYYNDTCAHSIYVKDTIPDGLKYKETLEPEEPKVNVHGNTLIWNFGEDEIIENGESKVVRFKAEVISGNYGPNKNIVNVTAEECCKDDLSGSDYAIVNIKPSINVQKEVWDPDEKDWVEHLDSVIKDVDVKFKITITYYGNRTIKCLDVKDVFLADGCGDCLEYIKKSANFDYPNEHFEPPEIIVGEDNKSVNFIWRDKIFNLKDKESVVITFKADVTHYCYEEGYYTVRNKASVEAFYCNGCEESLEGYDHATVNCRPHDPVFEKTVLDGDEWAEETYSYKGERVSFKIELTYYGSYNLTDIIIKDKLPSKILKFISAEPPVIKKSEPVSYVREELEEEKIIRWGITDSLNDSETLKIIFVTEVIGSTGDYCKECGINTANYTAKESVTDTDFEGIDTAKVITGDEIIIGFSVKNFGWTRVRANVRNRGHEDLEDVRITLSVKGGLLGRIDDTATKTVSLFKEDRMVPISLSRRSIIRNFGRITITITVDIPGARTREDKFNGFALGRLVIVRPLIKLGR